MEGVYSSRGLRAGPLSGPALRVLAALRAQCTVSSRRTSESGGLGLSPHRGGYNRVLQPGRDIVCGQGREAPFLTRSPQTEMASPPRVELSEPLALFYNQPLAHRGEDGAPHAVSHNTASVVEGQTPAPEPHVTQPPSRNGSGTWQRGQEHLHPHCLSEEVQSGENMVTGSAPRPRWRWAFGSLQVPTYRAPKSPEKESVRWDGEWVGGDHGREDGDGIGPAWSSHGEMSTGGSMTTVAPRELQKQTLLAQENVPLEQCYPVPTSFKMEHYQGEVSSACGGSLLAGEQGPETHKHTTQTSCQGAPSNSAPILDEAILERRGASASWESVEIAEALSTDLPQIDSRAVQLGSRALGFRAPPPVRGAQHGFQDQTQAPSPVCRGLADLSPVGGTLGVSSSNPNPLHPPSPTATRTGRRSPDHSPVSQRPARWEPPRRSHKASEIVPRSDERRREDLSAPNVPASGREARPSPHPQGADPVGPNGRSRSAEPLREHWQRGEGGSSDRPNPPKRRRQTAPRVEDHSHSEGKRAGETNPTTTKPSLALTSDPRVCDVGRLSLQERKRVWEEMGRAQTIIVTMVYQDGTTQLDPVQKSQLCVCGVLLLLRRGEAVLARPEQPVGCEERLLYLRLEQPPPWAQQHPHHQHSPLTRELLVQVLCGAMPWVCYKAKELLATVLRHCSPELGLGQVSQCKVLDPQIAAWLLDSADSASCFQELLLKYCSPPAGPPIGARASGLSVGPRRVTQVITSISLLHRVMLELRTRLQTQGLWQLYVHMEQKMVPVLAAMESHRIHVDKDALKRTSDILGTNLKLLQQEAHKAAGQQFLVSSSAQLRLVLFEKLQLHKRCENKKLPKTVFKQQQSTSEAVLLQLQDLHPLPKIILEYRQVHKVKSTFVDGILACMNKSYISSTWNQTSAVTGRLSAKHPNFQALPKQPVQIAKKQYVQGKEAEVVTVHPRAMFIPREGWTFLSADFCQVELRLLAHLSSDPELLRIFQNPDTDVFTMLASQWKRVNEESVSLEDREQAKRIVYSVVYGAGRERLAGILGVSAEQAGHFQDSFLHTYREVQAFIQHTIQQCHRQGYVVSMMGRRRSLPHIRSADWAARNQAERQAVNFVVQASAADLCKMAMIQIFSQVASSACLTARLVAQIHDELLFEVEDSQVEDFAVLVKRTMESVQHIDCLGTHLSVPLKVALSRGRSWGSMSELTPPNTPSSTTL